MCTWVHILFNNTLGHCFFFKVLTDSFRLDYCRLWQALIKADIKQIKKYSQRLGAGDLYPLFACMLTARSWESVNKGIDRLPVSSNEVHFLGITDFKRWHTKMPCSRFTAISDRISLAAYTILNLLSSNWPIAVSDWGSAIPKIGLGVFCIKCILPFTELPVQTSSCAIYISIIYNIYTYIYI